MTAPRPATGADRARALAEAALARGHALRRAGRAAGCRTGIAPYESAERGFADLGLPNRRAETLLGLGLLHKECLRDDAAALRVLTQALPLFLGSEDGEKLVRQRLGEARFALGDLDGAIGEYRRALELRRQTGDRAGEALTSNNLGYALDLRGRYDEAAALFDRALALGREGDDPRERGNALLNRGHLHRELGESGARPRAVSESARRCSARPGTAPTRPPP